MIERIIWSQYKSKNIKSPFLCRDIERPIRITFHTSSYKGATGEEKEAIEVLREFSNLPEIKAIDTEDGPLPFINIGSFNHSDEDIPITLEGNEGPTYSYVSDQHGLKRMASAFVRKAKLRDSEIEVVLNDLILTAAHNRLGQDIFVTLSIHILANRKSHFRYENPRTPIETAKIVGLFLRSRGEFTWQAWKRYRGRGFFYRILALHKLPSMNRYLSACSHASEVRDDNIETVE